MSGPAHRPDGSWDATRTELPEGTDLSLYADPGRRSLPPGWPSDRAVAVILAVWVESAEPMLPDGEWAPSTTPRWLDVSAWSLYEYGARVGVFRRADILERAGVPATLAISDPCAARAPAVLELAARRDWEVVAHGAAANRLITSQMSAQDELAYLTASRVALQQATGAAPRGWVGPDFSESQRTPRLAAQAGYGYLMDWGNDDRPSAITGESWSIASVPSLVDLSDHLVLSGTADTPWSFAETLRDHLACLLAEERPAVMTVTLRAHLSGQPFRAGYIEKFLTFARSCEHVWFPTAGQVVDASRLTATT
jgi:allantoinase